MKVPKMSTRPGQELDNLSPKKRPQKYTGMELQPGDEEFLDRLSPRHQEILRTKGTYHDLAAAFGVAVGTIRSRLHRARAALFALRERSTQQSPLQNEIAVH